MNTKRKSWPISTPYNIGVCIMFHLNSLHFVDIINLIQIIFTGLADYMHGIYIFKYIYVTVEVHFPIQFPICMLTYLYPTTDTVIQHGPILGAVVWIAVSGFNQSMFPPTRAPGASHPVLPGSASVLCVVQCPPRSGSSPTLGNRGRDGDGRFGAKLFSFLFWDRPDCFRMCYHNNGSGRGLCHYGTELSAV